MSGRAPSGRGSGTGGLAGTRTLGCSLGPGTIVGPGRGYSPVGTAASRLAIVGLWVILVCWLPGTKGTASRLRGCMASVVAVGSGCWVYGSCSVSICATTSCAPWPGRPMARRGCRSWIIAGTGLAGWVRFWGISRIRATFYVSPESVFG